MNKLKKIYATLGKTGQKTQDVSLLLMRLVLAYGFYGPAMMKWQDIHAIGNWFKSMGYPAPYFNAYIVGITELAGVVLLFLGFGIRVITLLLIFVMVVAIITVHLRHGFEAGNNGFEIPLYYAIMLLVLFSFGAGKYSLDYFLKK